MSHTDDESLPPVDVAILTVKIEEFRAVLDQLDIDQPEFHRGEREYAVVSVSGANGGDGLLVGITRCPTQGNGVSQDVARSIIADLDPQWILLVGIAGGLPATEFSLGDVVLARSVVDFSVEKVASGGDLEFDTEGRLPHADVENFVSVVNAYETRLGDWSELTIRTSSGRVPLPRPTVVLSKENFYGDADWQLKVRRSLEHWCNREPARPIVTSVKMASSDRLLKDTKPLEVLLPAIRKIEAVEMEASGVYIAARGRGSARRSYPVLTIRGISDIIGFRHDEAWTQYACHSAASFAAAFLRSGRVVARQANLSAPTRSGSASESLGGWSSAPETRNGVEQRLAGLGLTLRDFHDCLEKLGASRDVTSAIEEALNSGGISKRGGFEGDVGDFVAKLLIAGSVDTLLSRRLYLSAAKATRFFRSWRAEIGQVLEGSLDEVDLRFPEGKITAIYRLLLAGRRLIFLPACEILERDPPKNSRLLYFFSGLFTLAPNEILFKECPEICASFEAETLPHVDLPRRVFNHHNPDFWPLLSLHGEVTRLPATMQISRKYVTVESMTNDRLLRMLAGHSISLTGLAAIDWTDELRLHPILM